MTHDELAPLVKPGDTVRLQCRTTPANIYLRAAQHDPPKAVPYQLTGCVKGLVTRGNRQYLMLGITGQGVAMTGYRITGTEDRVKEAQVPVHCIESVTLLIR